MQAVDVSQLEKRFSRRRAGRRDSFVALAGVSFTIAPGECVAVLGQNGSGKSTLIRMLSTLLLPDGGSAKVFGHDVVREAGAVRRLVESGFGGGIVLQADVGDREPELRSAFLRSDTVGHAEPDPGDPLAGRLPGVAVLRADAGPEPRHAAEGRAREGAADLAGAAAARRADDRT